jgi:hypothetical protein
MNAGGQEHWIDLPLRPAAWVATACAIAGQPLTLAEWREYVGDRPYRPTC